QAKRKSWFPGPQHFVEGPLQEPFAGKPVVPVAKSLDAVRSRHLGLRGSRLRNSQIVEPEISGEMGLVVAGEERFRLGNISPFGEPRSPPKVILRNRMELREVECNDSSLRSRHGRRRLTTATRRRDGPRARGTEKVKPCSLPASPTGD